MTSSPQSARARGDVLLGLHSPGLRSNGYTLAREVLVSDASSLAQPAYRGRDAHARRGAALAVSDLRALRGRPARASSARAFTPPRTSRAVASSATSRGCSPRTSTRRSTWTTFATPEIFFEIQRRGPVSAEEMVRVFNCGLGMVVALDPSAADAALTLARASGVDASLVGVLRPGTGQVVLT